MIMIVKVKSESESESESESGIKLFGSGGENVKHAGLGSPAADACKLQRLPGKPCALTGCFYAFSSPAHKKWVSSSDDRILPRRPERKSNI